ncbi:MAG: hypothetical protein ABIJ61_04810 [bacterium]
MKKHLLLLAVLLLPCLLLADKFDFPIGRIDQTLRYIAIDTSDISFRTDRTDLDSFRLAVVDELTLKPLEIPGFLKRIGDLLLDSTATSFDAWWLLGSESQAGHYMIIMGDRDHNLDQLLRPPFPAGARGEPDIARVLRKEVADCQRGMKKWGDSFAALFGSSLDQQQLAFVQDSFKIFLLEEEKNMQLSVAEADSLQKLEGRLAGSFARFGFNIPILELKANNHWIVQSHAELSVRLAKNRKALRALDTLETNGLFETTQTEIGRVAIGGPGNDRYEGKYAVIIDLGGDDEYLLEYDPEHPNQIIIDLDGNDRYYAQTDHCLGAGFMGCGILDDWAGDDIYFAKHFSLGCGLFGTGILIDRGGDDIYQGDICTQGASSFGIGMLLDYEGNDSYTAHLFSQAFAFIMGASALVDHSGNDIYTAGWKYGDVLRYEDHYLSLSQGFGYGLRPHFSGGVAFLVDGGGNDQYSADIFAQGASYWWSFGGLIDYSGTDRYIAHQYAQGAATHLCLAALIDIEGDDLYSSKGVSQGCGHDLAFGLLLDCDGDDQYNAFDLSQAAGSANGVGMLIDLAGNDGHMARVKGNTHGYGNPRRDYGSIGLFLDLGGNDDYRGYGANNSYWVTDSKWGIGGDLEPKGDDEN